MSYKLYTDGGSRGNPGDAAIGALLFDAQDNLIWMEGKYIGKSTNNIAEYTALFEGLKFFMKNISKGELICNLDSELIVKQLNGEYKMKNKNLKPLYNKILDLIDGKNVKFVHVYREKNEFADKLVNISLDAHAEN